MSSLARPFLFALSALSLLVAPDPLTAAELKILFPQQRTAFQTNEWIEVAVLRSAAEALPAASLTLALSGADASRLEFAFAVPAVPAVEGSARASEHYRLSGHLLRPGKYRLEVRCSDAATEAPIEIYSHVRRSDYKLINWGRAKGDEQLLQGEESFGFNLFYGHYGQDESANLIRAGVDFMSNCTMSGGHQMDLRNECDWSDPYVTRGGAMRVVRRALIDRGRPNVPGVHFYDEPGLTWDKHPVTGEFGPHGVPAQARAYAAAFGRPPISYHEVNPKNPEHVARWNHWARWKLSFMDAAWKEAQFGVSWVRPDFLSVTQSQYGFSAFTDGYYFNVARSLPVTSGHGGYHDYGPGYFNPSYHLEMARARDHYKPCWYLPCWYGNTTSDHFRLEQYLSFQTNIQGMISPPDMEPATNALGRQGIVETNLLFQRLGPIFNGLPVTKPPVALLYSLSQMIHTQTADMQANYAHAMPHGVKLPLAYLAGKTLQHQFLPIVEEDVLEGTLAADHKAVLLVALDYLEPAVISALEDFISEGGLVLLTADCTVRIRGGVKLTVAPKMPDQERIDELTKEKKYNELGPFTTMGKYYEGAAPLAEAIRAELDKRGIRPVFECDNRQIIATRQAAGDVEYLFAVNASYDAEEGKQLSLKAAAATISIPDDYRPVYDAIVGGRASFSGRGDKFIGQFRFGPGQMRVFARTARPIGQVRLATPVVTRELVRAATPEAGSGGAPTETFPLRLNISAVVLDTAHKPLSGPIPLHVRVVDSLGVARYELFQATRNGQLQVALPLAANDLPGNWKVSVSELLSNTTDEAPFKFVPPQRLRTLAGAAPRALFAEGDRYNVFRFVRLHHDVTIVSGTSPYNQAAAARLAKILEPWGVRCKHLELASAAKSRTLSEEEAKTWCGLSYAGKGQIKPGDGNPPAIAGFAVEGPVILLGTPEDHPIVKFLLAEKFLPYAPDANFPGRGRGLVTWQRDGVGRGQESLALIAYDEAGMNEAVGSLYEAAAGLDPLTRWVLPESDSLSPAKTAPGLLPAAPLAWTAHLPDRVLSISLSGEKLSALTHDGSLTTLDSSGKVGESRPFTAAELESARRELTAAAEAAAESARKQTRPDRLVKLAAAAGGKVAVAYWGGTLRVVDERGAIQSEQRLPQDITALAWSGERLLCGLADGRVLALNAAKR